MHRQVPVQGTDRTRGTLTETCFAAVSAIVSDALQRTERH